MAKNSIIYKVILTFIIILAVSVIIWITRIPKKEEKLTEQIEEIEWENIDQIRFSGRDNIEIRKSEDGYELLKDDTILDVESERIRDLFVTFNQLKFASLSSVEFNEWSQTQNDSMIIMLQLFENTEEVLNLYIHPKDSTTHFRYMGSNDIFESERIGAEEFVWIDSLMRLD